MHERARELNGILDRGPAGPLLSEVGRRLYMPRGIPAQAAEARLRASRIDASAGMAFRGREPLHLGVVQEQLAALRPAEVYPYSPTTGNIGLRERWRELLAAKNPSLRGAQATLPVVVPGLTFGISAAADLFLEPGDPVLVPQPAWDNYELVFSTRAGKRVVGWPLFTDGDRLDCGALRHALRSASGSGRAAVLLNFPHNPSGYTPAVAEAQELVDVLKEAAEQGRRLLVILDDAYFGLVYEPQAYRESLFGPLASAHPGILAMKVDGTTKEELAWGFRIAFVTFAGSGLDREQSAALEEKLCGYLRSTVSSASTPAQTVLLRALDRDGYTAQKAEAFRVLEQRYRRVRVVLGEHGARMRELGIRPLPFNSGYFVSLRLKGGGADGIRRCLLEEGIGTIGLGDDLLRIAYSSVDLEQLETLFVAIMDAVAATGRGT